jgi:uncharacterized protein (UPF0128 family)
MSDKSHREITVKFRTTPEEYELIREKSELAGIKNLSAYIRKMAIDGYIVKLELPELREMISLLRRSSGNLNQIARRVNSTNRVYARLTSLREPLLSVILVLKVGKEVSI